MAVYTDNPAFAATLLPRPGRSAFRPWRDSGAAASHLHALFPSGADIRVRDWRQRGWTDLVVCDFAHDSQYDQLIRLARSAAAPPDRLVCLARSGTGFHGAQGRPWATCAGNIHLAVHLAPQLEVERFDTAFTVLAVVAVIEAIDALPGLHGAAHIKWVNDVLVGGAKVGGVLAYTQTQERIVTSAVLGIGLNVESKPAVARSRFVPAAACLREHAPQPEVVRLDAVLRALLTAIERNYAILLTSGIRPLLARYRERSLVLGREVTICDEAASGSGSVFAAGVVAAIGDGLELELHGRAEPVRRGRLLLAEPPA